MKTGFYINPVRILLIAGLFPIGSKCQVAWSHTVDSLALLGEQSAAAKVYYYAQAAKVALQNDLPLSSRYACLALQQALKTKQDSNLAIAYAAMSDVQLIKNNTDSTMEYALRGITYIKKAGLSPEIAASLYRKLGFVYRNIEKYHDALLAYQKALLYATEKHNQLDIAHTKVNIGQIYDLLNRPDLACTYYDEALRNGKEQRNSDILMRTFLNIAKLYERKKAYLAAYQNYEQGQHWADSASSKHSRELFYENYAGFLIRYSTYLKGVNIRRAAKYLEQVQELASAHANTDDNTMDYHLNKALLEMLSGHTRKAGKELDQYEIIKDTIQKRLIRGHAQKLQAVYESTQKEASIWSLKQENAYKQRLLWLFAGILVVLAVLLTLLWQQKRRIARQQKHLSLMMLELHHRVKNNLQIVSSLLNIQTMRISDTEVQEALREGQFRIEAMSLIHQKLYQGNCITTININEYLGDLTRMLMRSYGFDPKTLRLKMDIRLQEIDVDEAIPMGLIINEVMTNAFKYAYNNIPVPELSVILRADENIRLEMADNGVGIDLEQWTTTPSFGKRLMQALIKQLKGQMLVEKKNGTIFTFIFPYRNAR